MTHIDVEMLGCIETDPMDEGLGCWGQIVPGSDHAKHVLARLEAAFLAEQEEACEPIVAIAKYNLIKYIDKLSAQEDEPAHNFKIDDVMLPK